jgi:hypothetical protein
MTVCRDLTVKEKEVEVKKKPIEFEWYLNDMPARRPASKPSIYKIVEKVSEMNDGRCFIRAISISGRENFYIGYWNDGVAE